MRERDAEEWEELARNDPYFAVLDSEGHRVEDGGESATAAFFQTGEDDIASLMPAIASLLGRPVPLASALDYGCGAGRLTLPLARLAGRVVGCDIAPTILLHARANAARAGLSNATFIGTDELPRLREAQFDFICALLVFEHIPPERGYEIIRTLLRLLSPGGIAAVHVTYAPPGARVRRFIRSMRGRSYTSQEDTSQTHISTPQGRQSQPPSSRGNEYDDRIIQRDVLAAGAHIAGKFPMASGGDPGAILVIEKRPED